jgi:hypothetical protein
MKTRALAFCILTFATCLRALGQSYVLDWSTIDGGGGTSTGGTYTVSGTIGQPDAGTMSGGNYTLQGGFWGVIAAVQTPGAPWLSVIRSNATVIVSWPKPAEGWNLEYTAVLTSGTNVWTQIPPPYQTNATECYVTEPTPSGNRFYRLHQPRILFSELELSNPNQNYENNQSNHVVQCAGRAGLSLSPQPSTLSLTPGHGVHLPGQAHRRRQSRQRQLQP